MTKLSPKTVDPEHMGWFINNFWITLTLLENKEEVRELFGEIFTHTELKMLAKRLQIAKMLLEGYSYDIIRSYVKVGDQTIARINNLLEEKGPGLKKAVQRLQKIEEERKKKIETNIFDDIKSKYPQHQWPEKIFSLITTSYMKNRKRASVYHV